MRMARSSGVLDKLGDQALPTGQRLLHALRTAQQFVAAEHNQVGALLQATVYIRLLLQREDWPACAAGRCPDRRAMEYRDGDRCSANSGSLTLGGKALDGKI